MKSRRLFIRNASLAAAGYSLAAGLPLEALAELRKKISPNDKLRVGAIGINGMGWSDLNSLLRNNPDTVCTALCDVDQNVLQAKAAQLEKDHQMKAKQYGDYRKLLDDKDVDVVVIGTPDHWHCLQTVQACQAGKDVYVEKPLGNSITECQVMVAAAEKYNRIVQVGQWQRSNAHFRSALDFLNSGKLGRIRMVKAWAYMPWNNVPKKPDSAPPPGVDYDMWLGPATKRAFNPNRFHWNFRWYWDYAGGLMTDWGVHLVDYALLGMNAKDPLSVMASGGKMAYPDDDVETPDTLATVYDFGNFILNWEHALAIGKGNYGKDHGIAYIGNNGTLILDRGGWQVMVEGNREKTKMEPVAEVKRSDDGLGNHTKNFIEAVKSRKADTLNAPVQAGATVAKVCQMGNIAYKTGTKLYWNQAQQKFDNAKANKLITAEYHNNYQLPKI